MDDEERREWVRNDEGLYRSWKRSRMGLYRFVKENRDVIDSILKARGVDVSPARLKKRSSGMVGRAGQSLRGGY
jgi:hypothetical protein